jgi:hypothetical protein
MQFNNTPWFVRYTAETQRTLWTARKAWKEFDKLADEGYDVLLTVYHWKKYDGWVKGKSWSVRPKYLDKVRKKNGIS